MRKCLLITILLVGLSNPAGAALIDRGGGMIYDSVLDITWLQDAGMGGDRTWFGSRQWANSLSYGGYNDWRTPSMDLNGDGLVAYCAAMSEEACRDNELAYMFFYYLGGSEGDGRTGDQGLILNIQPIHWSASALASNPAEAWGFYYALGFRAHIPQGAFFAAWAVRDGDVSPSAVPLPASLPLLLMSLCSLVATRFSRLSRPASRCELQVTA